MKVNYETVIFGQHCILVPYRAEHVARYHEWMQDPALLEATGSEPLTLDEEYEMQNSWRDDETKCTFIVLARSLLKDVDVNETTVGHDFIQKSIGAMVGDVNLFLSEEDDGEDEEQGDNNQLLNGSTTRLGQDMSRHRTTSTNNVKRPRHLQAELDIMVAEKSARSQGVGSEACCLMMLYGATHLSIRRFFCKINESNEASLCLFRDKLGFQQCDYAACFRQIELELKEESPSRMIAKLSGLSCFPDYGLRTGLLTALVLSDDS